MKVFQHHSSVWYVVHLTTLERVALPAGGKWELAFDDDGFAGAVDDSEPQKFDPSCLELLFKKCLCETIKGLVHAVYDQSGSSPIVWTVANRLKRYVGMEFTFSVGAMSKPHKHAGVQVATPRGGCVHFWDACGLYAALKLNTYKGKQSKWVYESMPSWIDQMTQMGFSGAHCIPSRKAEASHKKVECRDVFKDALAGSVISTCCLVQLLVRWSAMKPQQGGLRHPKAQAAALSMLDGLLASTVDVSGEWTLPVHFCRVWQCEWPCLDTRAADVLLSVKDGIVDLQPWVDLPVHGLATVGGEWLREVQLAGGGRAGKVALSQVLLRIVDKSVHSSLLGQLIWACTIKVEFALVTYMKQGLGKGCVWCCSCV